jgi:hypothetical protein
MSSPLPIACSLPHEQYAARSDQWNAVAAEALIEAGKTSSGAVQRYRASDRVERELKELIRLEGECCPFLGFDLKREKDEIVLEVTGPDQASDLLADFARVPRG